MRYRHDIAGLRAIAVTAVVLFHFSIPGFSGGFSGVDVFFVISGYLMTSIIFTAIEERRFSLIDFYLSRFKRIIPALAVMLLATYVIIWFVYSGDAIELMTVAKHLASSLTFISNFIYFSETGYFDQAAHTKWFLHTWSLSIEWQFYILFPLVVLMLKRCCYKKSRQLITALFFASFAASVILSSKNDGGAFFLPHTRLWELLAGSLVFLWPIKISRFISRAFLLIGLVLIAYSVTAFHENLMWPGYHAFIPVLGTMLIIYADIQNFFVLSSRLSQWFGRISYSLYLWHWPIVVGLHYFQLIDEFWAITMGLAASCMLAHLSANLVERKNWLLFGTAKKNLTLYFITSISVALLIFIGNFKLYENAPGNKILSLSNDAILAERKRYWKGKYSEKPFEKDGEKKILVIGNSWAIDLMYAFKSQGFKADIDFIGTSHQCFYFGFEPRDKTLQDKCDKINQKILNSKLWLEADEIWLHDFYRGYDLSILEKRVLDLSKLTEAPIKLFGPKMDYNKSVPKLVRKAFKKGKFNPLEWQNYIDEKQEGRFSQNTEIKNKFDTNVWRDRNLHYIDVLAAQCGGKSSCPAVSKKGELLYFDAEHLTLKGAEGLGEALKENYPYLF